MEGSSQAQRDVVVDEVDSESERKREKRLKVWTAAGSDLEKIGPSATHNSTLLT
jgi:hypothetical protein